MRMSDDSIKRIHAKVMGDLLETGAGGVAMGGQYEKVKDSDASIYEDIYSEQGFANRKEYLGSLGEDFGVPVDIVYMLASLYGPTEDFDGLVTAVEDYAESHMDDDDYMDESDSLIKVVHDIPKGKAEVYLKLLARTFPDNQFAYDPERETISINGSQCDRVEDFINKTRLAVDVKVNEVRDPNDNVTIDMFGFDDDGDDTEDGSIYTYTIDSNIAAYLVNGDSSDISEEDAAKADELVTTLGRGHWDVGEESHDSECDLSGFSNRCVEMTFHPHDDEISRISELAGL